MNWHTAFAVGFWLFGFTGVIGGAALGLASVDKKGKEKSQFDGCGCLAVVVGFILISVAAGLTR